jgi:predicted ATPase/DNA-binding SARP family transcriptional activator
VLLIQLLGGCKLVHEGLPLADFDKSRLQSLTAYLALNRYAPQARSRLAFLFWPDSSEAQAHTNLRKLFHQFRNAIPRADDFIRTEGKTVQWRADAPFELDVADFERAVAAGDFQRAVTLYQGDLLPECYEDWVLVERERLRRIFIRTLEQLLDQLERGRQYRTAIEYGQRLQRYDPLREDTYCRLMRLYALEGDRGNVVRTYENCVSVLQLQLSISPSAATRQAYQECLRMDPSPNLLQPNKSSLPVRLSSFVGRTREISEVQSVLKTSRLLTLTGAGGCGKTRLAQQVATEIADRYRDGVTWVELAVLSDPEFVPQAIASALGLGNRTDDILTELISDHLRTHNVLLLLDNCEHLVVACARFVEALLSACPDQQILATSREALNIACETVWIVPSMSIPDLNQLASNWETTTVASLTSYDAVGLFVERATMICPTFDLNKHNGLSVAQICHRLDGIPLAIELAAGRSKILSPEQIASRLHDRFNLLIGGSRISLPRYQTLRAAIDWSYELLSDPERILFRRLAVFTGSFSLEATEAVCAGWQLADDLRSSEILALFSQLVEKSLVVAEDRTSATRYRLLETVREYALDKLREPGEVETGRTRHLEYFRNLAESLEPSMQIAWPVTAADRLEREYSNVLAALKWGAAHEPCAESGLRLVGAVPEEWLLRKEVVSTESGLRKLLTNDNWVIPNQVRAKALIGLGGMALYRSDFAEGYDNFELSLKLSRELDYKPGMASALYFLGFLTGELFDLATARAYIEECLTICRAIDDRYGAAVALQDLGNILYWQGETALGRDLVEESLATLRNLGVQTWTARAMLYLGHIARREGAFGRARSLYVEAMSVIKDQQSLPMVSSWGIQAFGFLAAAKKQFDQAARLFGALDRLAQELGASQSPADLVEYDVYLAAAQTALGETRFKAGWDAGRRLSLGQALAYAFSPDDSAESSDNDQANAM